MENDKTNNTNRFTVFAKKNLSQIIGIVLGTAAGYLYYRTVGCTSGSCGITSNVWLSMTWGAGAGYLIAGMFKKGGCGCGFSNNPTCDKK